MRGSRATTFARLLVCAAFAAVAAVAIRTSVVNWVMGHIPRLPSIDGVPLVQLPPDVHGIGEGAPVVDEARGPLPSPTVSHEPLPLVTTRRLADGGPSTPGVAKITRAALEKALETRLDGATTAALRDESNNIVGLAVYNVGALSAFGIQDGDVLVSANGLPLRTPEECLTAFGKLKDVRRVSVTFRRGAQAYSVAAELDEP